MLRVSGGALRGRRLQVPRSGVRPTSERGREALFSALGTEVVDAHVLDLFAGSGALGIEAASRGAARVTFVEGARRVARDLRANLGRCDLDEAVVIVADWRAALARLAGQGARFDLVLADPPWRLEDPGGIVDEIVHRELLTAGGTLVIEHRSNAALEIPEPGVCLRTLRAGDTSFGFCGVVEPGEPPC